MTLFVDMFLENTGVLFDFHVDFPCCINTPALPKSRTSEVVIPTTCKFRLKVAVFCVEMDTAAERGRG